MGVERWIDQQLHPETIDDSALEAKLNALPAMRLSTEELIRRFPPPQIIRQMDAGKITCQPTLSSARFTRMRLPIIATANEESTGQAKLILLCLLFPRKILQVCCGLTRHSVGKRCSRCRQERYAPDEANDCR